MNSHEGPLCRSPQAADTERDSSDGVFGVGAGASSTHGVGVAAELEDVAGLDLQNLLESAPDLHQSVLAARLALSSCPQANSVEAFSDVDNNTHDFIVALIFQSLSNGCELSMKPELVDVDLLLVFELERPLASVLVLLVFPLRSDASLEEVVV